MGAYVIVPSHINIIWCIQNDYKLEHVQRNLLRFTAKKIIETIKQLDGQKKLEEIYDGAKDRTF